MPQTLVKGEKCKIFTTPILECDFEGEAILIDMLEEYKLSRGTLQRWKVEMLHTGRITIRLINAKI